MVFTHKIVCRKSPKLYASYHDQTLKKTCFNLTERAAFNLLNNTIYRPVFVLQGGGFRTSWVRFSVLRRTRTGFLEVGVWNRFVGFWVNAVGFSTALFPNVNQLRILQLPQGVDGFLPSAVEQLHYLVDGIVEVNPPVFICPAVFSG